MCYTAIYIILHCVCNAAKFLMDPAESIFIDIKVAKWIDIDIEKWISINALIMRISDKLQHINLNFFLR